MFCKNCGSQLHENAAFCVNCGAAAGQGNGYCQHCGNQVLPNAVVCLNCGAALGGVPAVQQVPVQQAQPGQPAPKSRMAAGLLGIFLGAFGVHNFYLGYTGKALAQVLMSGISLFLTLITCGILFILLLAMAAAGIWGLIEGILILSGSPNYTTDARGIPLVQ